MHWSIGVVAASWFVVSLGAQTWNRADAFPSAGSGIMTHDRDRDRVVMFGHYNGDDVTWEWTGATWSPNHTATYPSVTFRHTLVYDDARRQTWLFDFGSRETWAYDGRMWSQVNTSMAPSYREAPSMVFDRQRDVAVLFGGQFDHHTVLSDTWEWDGTSWTQAQPPVIPGARAGHAMTYDPVAGEVLMFGGSNLQGVLDDTWAWDGTFWVQQQAFVRPAARWGSAMAFDSVRQRPLLFGGRSIQTYDDTWEWTGSNWQQLQPATTPPWDFGAALVAHDGTNSLLLHGAAEGQTWRWDGTDWSLAQDWPAPALMESAAAADRARGKIVVFGDARGNSTFPAPVPTGTWEWDGIEWERKQPAVEPPSRGYGAMASDPLLGKTILYGGQQRVNYQWLFDTWEWDGNQWTQRFPTTSPQVRLRSTMYFDATIGRAVLATENVAGQPTGFYEWTWDGNDWQPLTSTTALGQFRAAGYDEARGVAVAVTSSGTFERVGGQWQQLTGAGPFFGAFDGRGFAYDPARQTMVAITYATSLGAYSAPAWEWDGLSWSSLPSAQGHGYYAARLLVEDPTRGQLTLIGGNILATRFWNLTDSPAFGEAFGGACGGSAGEVTVTARGKPRTGNAAFGVDVDHALPGALVLLGISIGEGNAPLGNGCSWYFGSPIASHVLFASASGFAAVDLPIPQSTAFRGIVLASQAFAIDPAGPHLGGLAASAGLRIRIGD